MQIKQIRIKLEDKDRKSLINRLSCLDMSQPIRRAENKKQRSIRKDI